MKKKNTKKVSAVVEREVTFSINAVNKLIDDAISSLMAAQLTLNAKATAIVEQKAVEMIERVAAHEGVTPEQLVSRAFPKAA
jgi:hypothetical protein